ncbi:MAG: DMT family transporter [Lautropia sp.]
MSSALSRTDALLLCVLTLLWGMNWPVMKLAVAAMPPMTFRTLSLFGGALFVAAVARWRGESLVLPRRWWGETALLGSFNMVIWYMVSIIVIQMLPAGRTAILAYTLPVWAALIGSVCYGERHGRRLIFALCAAMLGAGLLLGQEFSAVAGSPLAALMMLGGSFSWALGTHWLRRRRSPTPILVLTFWMMVQAGLVCALAALAFERDQWHGWFPATGWMALSYNAFLAYGIGQIVWFRLASKLPPLVSALSVMMIPVTGVFTSVLALGERPGWRDIAALVSILIAIAATVLPARPDPPRPAKPS